MGLREVQIHSCEGGQVCIQQHCFQLHALLKPGILCWCPTCLSAVFLMMPRCSAVLEMRVVFPPSLPFSAIPQRTRWGQADVSTQTETAATAGGVTWGHSQAIAAWRAKLGPPGGEGGEIVFMPTCCFSLPHVVETGKAATCSPHDFGSKEQQRC